MALVWELILASDWSSDVRSHVMGGNRGPVVKRDRGLTGSHVIWKGKPLTSGKKGSWAQATGSHVIWETTDQG